jgi:hypothetical protein
VMQPGKPPSPGGPPSSGTTPPSPPPAASRFAEVIAILETLVGGKKFGGPHKNFWWKDKTNPAAGFVTRDVFVALNVVGLPLLVVGDPDNSNLVKALEGLPPFDDSDYPRMPVAGSGRRYAKDPEMKSIRQWIKDGCPP